jgi:hypothetical protein
MKGRTTTNLLLLIIAVALVTIAARPYHVPHPVQAQNVAAYPVYFEPGTQMLRSPDGNQNVYGRMVVDLQTGQVWGFPTLTSAPYPVDISSAKPPVSHPFLLGRFALEDIYK